MTSNHQLRIIAASFSNDLATATQGLKPVQAGKARERVLVDFLMAISNVCNANLERPVGIDARGDIQVFGVAAFRDGPVASYGEDFAAVLSLIPRRTGTQATTTEALPENGWCHVNHFDMERLMRGLADGTMEPLAQ